PRDDSVSNSDPVNVTPLQFGEKVGRLHPSPNRMTFSFSLNDRQEKIPFDSFIHYISISTVMHHSRTESHNRRGVQRHCERQLEVAQLAQPRRPVQEPMLLSEILRILKAKT